MTGPELGPNTSDLVRTHLPDLEQMWARTGPELVQNWSRAARTIFIYGPNNVLPQNDILISSGPDVGRICAKTVFSIEMYHMSKRQSQFVDLSKVMTTMLFINVPVISRMLHHILKLSKTNRTVFIPKRNVLLSNKQPYI